MRSKEKAPLVNHRWSGLFKASWPRNPTRACARAGTHVAIISAPQQTIAAEPVTTTVQLPNQTPPNSSPGRRSHLHRPGCHGVLGTATPPTLARADIACKVAYLPQLAVFRHGAPEPRRGVLFSRRVNVHNSLRSRLRFTSRAGESGVRRRWPWGLGYANRAIARPPRPIIHVG